MNKIEFLSSVWRVQMPCSPHYSRFGVCMSINGQKINLDFELFLGPNYSWICLISLGIQYSPFKSCWLTQESLKHDPFSTFSLIDPNSIIKKNGKKSKLFQIGFGSKCFQNQNFWIQVDLKPILNDQVGYGTRYKLKMSRKTDFHY